jgi:hypothetical protein
VLVLTQELRVMVSTGDANEASAWALIDRACWKRRIAVVIYTGNVLVKAWPCATCASSSTKPTRWPAPHAVIALPGGVDRVAVRQDRAAGLPVWAPDRQALARMMRAGRVNRGRGHGRRGAQRSRAPSEAPIPAAAGRSYDGRAESRSIATGLL